MNEPSTMPVGGLVAGGAGVTFPLWNETLSFLTGANQFLIALMGLVVLVLTARKLWLDNQYASRRLRELDKPPDGGT